MIKQNKVNIVSIGFYLNLKNQPKKITLKLIFIFTKFDQSTDLFQTSKGRRHLFKNFNRRKFAGFEDLARLQL